MRVNYVLVVTSLCFAVAFGASTGCDLVLRPCDETFGSRMNQTFAYVGVGGPYVQLNAYWGFNSACVGVSAIGEVSLSSANCHTNDSLFSYGPGDIKTWVFYKHLNSSLCLQADADHWRVVAVKCDAAQPKNQMWMEPPTMNDPYNRILTSNDGISTSNNFCMTRIGDENPC
eukprot:PhM_4_TR16917/c0_g2_i1/m.82755